MLAKLHRVGPGRHRLLKGYILAGAADVNALSGDARAIEDLSHPCRSAGFTLQVDHRCPTRVWIDTGPVWIHSRDARAALRSKLAAATAGLAGRVRQRGWKLIPNAVRDNSLGDWRHSCVADLHRIEVEDDIERQVLSNTLRSHVALLIAASGRSGADARGVEAGGSKRLAESRSQIAARLFPTTSVRQGPRIASYFRSRMGVPRIDQLDINPFDAERCGDYRSVECRFIDAQILVGSSIAHTILLQAIALSVRRRVRREPLPFQVVRSSAEEIEFGKIRAAAIARGLNASVDGGPGSARRGAPEALLELLEGLGEELRILEVDLSELAPLLVGCMLRSRGLPAFANENDLLRHWARSGASSLVVQSSEILLNATKLESDPLTELNRTTFREETEQAMRFWANVLRHRSAALPVPAEAPEAETPSTNPLAVTVAQLRTASEAQLGQILRRTAVDLKRRNWSEWLDQLGDDDRSSLLARLGLTKDSRIRIGRADWGDAWGDQLRRSLNERGWAIGNLVMSVDPGTSPDAAVRGFLERLPDDVYGICLRFRPLDDREMQVAALFLDRTR
jgi:hypothetical protein